MEQVCGKETDPTLLFTEPGAYRSSLVSTRGAQPAETWCPNQGAYHPRCRVREGGHPRDCGHVTPVQGLGGVLRWRL